MAIHVPPPHPPFLPQPHSRYAASHVHGWPARRGLSPCLGGVRQQVWAGAAPCLRVALCMLGRREPQALMLHTARDASKRPSDLATELCSNLLLSSSRKRHWQVCRFALAVDPKACSCGGLAYDTRGTYRGAARAPKHACSCRASPCTCRTPSKARPPPNPTQCRREQRLVSQLVVAEVVCVKCPEGHSCIGSVLV